MHKQAIVTRHNQRSDSSSLGYIRTDGVMVENEWRKSKQNWRWYTVCITSLPNPATLLSPLISIPSTGMRQRTNMLAGTLLQWIYFTHPPPFRVEFDSNIFVYR